MSTFELLFGPLDHVILIEGWLALSIRNASTASKRLIIRSETGSENSLGLVLVDVIFESHSFVVALDRRVILVKFGAQNFMFGPLNFESLQR